jgi:uncharacterized protein
MILTKGNIMLSTKTHSYRKTIFWFLLINFFFSIAVNFSYIIMAPGIESPLSKLFVYNALISNVAIIYMIIAFLISMTVVITKKSVIILTASILIMITFHMFNALDIIIFHIFKYHINSMVMALVFTEGAGDSLHLGQKTILSYCAILGVIITLETVLLQRCHRSLQFLPSSRKVARISLVFALLFIFADKTTYAVADLYNINDVMRCAKVFPFYQSITVKDFMNKFFGFAKDREDWISLNSRKSTSLSYPLKELHRKPMEDYPNIIWILIDSWRFDMLSQEVTPNIMGFSRDAVVFTNHYSGGNASRFGVFTLMYGVYGSYWHSFLAERQSPVFLDELMKLGYEFKIISSSKLTNPEFRKTAFVKLSSSINDSLDDTLPAEKGEGRDSKLARMFIDWMKERKKEKPFYAFLFLDAPHGPSTYPQEFEKYKPSNMSPNYVMTGKKDVVPIFNSYRNSILFDDFLVGKILTEIKKLGLDKNSIILITSDHGDEFLENGYWGHTSAFSRYQSKVPFVVHIPGVPHREVKELTSHLDVVPTILGLLGYTTPPQEYSQGKSMLSGNGHSFVVVAGWDDCAIIDRDNAIVLPLNLYNAGGYEVRTAHDYRMIRDEHAVFKQKQDTIMSVMKGMSVFFR